ncbi:MAG: hypothetical protein RJB13_478 [Pseudomonadota bacterium]|jgi:hypothetical protein
MDGAETIEEGFELNKSLRNLRNLRAIRQQSLAELQKFIDSALLTGKLSGRRKHNTDRNCLSKRAVATLEQEASQLKRNLFYLMERERQILSRLAEIGDLGGQTAPVEESELTEQEGIQAPEGTQEGGLQVDDIEKTA